MRISREYDPELSSILFAGTFFFAGLVVFQHSTGSESLAPSLLHGSAAIACFCLSYVYALRGVQEALPRVDPDGTKTPSGDGDWTTVRMERYLVEYLRYRGMTEYGTRHPNETVYRMAEEDDDVEVSELRSDGFDVGELREEDVDVDVSDLR
jgi:hypothetical protein